jgi:uncharacterized protein
MKFVGLLFFFALSTQSYAQSKIGIIGGGGAGLAAAWLLENDAQVTLFEREDRLGGHGDTVFVPSSESGKDIPVDAGFEFFSDASAPYFIRYLKSLNVRIHPIPATFSFFRTDRDDSLVITPFHDGKIQWSSFSPYHFLRLLQMKYALTQGKKFASLKNPDPSVESFVNCLSYFATSSFKQNLLYPFLAAAWGVSLEEIKEFSAYDVMSTITQGMSSWSVKPPTLNEVEGGTSAYIDAVSRQVSKTEIYLNTEISEIIYDGHRYTVSVGNSKFYFDELVFATPANEAARLLTDVSEASEVRDLLTEIKYYPTRIGIHGNFSFMPQKKSDWSVVNVRYDGNRSAMTIYHASRSRDVILKSWLMPGEEEPKPLYSLRNYMHPTIDSTYFKVQRELESFQGQNHLWFAGVYTYGVNSHESAIRSAVRVAQHLAPGSVRLAELESGLE